MTTRMNVSFKNLSHTVIIQTEYMNKPNYQGLDTCESDYY